MDEVPPVGDLNDPAARAASDVAALLAGYSGLRQAVEVAASATSDACAPDPAPQVSS